MAQSSWMRLPGPTLSEGTMFGFVGTSRQKIRAPDLKATLLYVLVTDKFRKITDTYNRWAERVGGEQVRQAVSVETIKPILESDTVVYRVLCNVFAGLFTKEIHGYSEPEPYLIQVSDRFFPTSAIRTMRHELLHL